MGERRVCPSPWRALPARGPRARRLRACRSHPVGPQSTPPGLPALAYASDARHQLGGPAAAAAGAPGVTFSRPARQPHPQSHASQGHTHRCAVRAPARACLPRVIGAASPANLGPPSDSGPTLAARARRQAPPLPDPLLEAAREELFPNSVTDARRRARRRSRSVHPPGEESPGSRSAAMRRRRVPLR